LEQIAENLWTFDGPTVRFMSVDFPTRMTIARINSGLWVHSPIAITPEIKQFVSDHGPVSHVVAPNNFHHLYLAPWLEEFPEARFYAAPGLREKRPDFRFTEDLLPGQEPNQELPWSGEVEHEHFVGNRMLQEVVFFHKASKTLILTDVLVNLNVDDKSWWQRTFAKFDAMAAPNGSTPRTLRLSMRDRKEALPCYERMIGWAPEKIVISHGDCLLANGTAELKKRLSWIVTG